MRWQDMTGPEVEEFANTTDLALLPVGCVEMHGPHVPSGSDAFIATEVCDRIAVDLGCIVLPTMYYNVNAMMKRFPGTISIAPDVLTPLYDSIFKECARNGFSKIFAVVCHGGSETPFQFLANLVHERATAEAPCKPARPDYYLFSKTLSMEGARRFAKTENGAFGHACEIETGLNIAARPDLVKLDRVQDSGPNYDRTVRANYHNDYINQVPLGYIGQPWLATPESGAKFMDAVVADFMSVAREIVAYSPGIDV